MLGLDIVENHLDENFNDHSKNVNWGIDQALPNLRSLNLYFLDRIKFENEHPRKNLVFHLHIDKLWLALDDVVLHFLD